MFELKAIILVGFVIHILLIYLWLDPITKYLQKINDKLNEIKNEFTK
jgi:hypothetical protein